ncbi:hypothetical protein ACFL01_02700 [Planctomycetota bacterium]
MSGRTIARVLVIAGFVLLLIGAVLLRSVVYRKAGYIVAGTAFLSYLVGRLVYLALFLKQRKEKA